MSPHLRSFHFCSLPSQVSLIPDTPYFPQLLPNFNCVNLNSLQVFLHPRSALHSSAPEYVVYTQLIRTVKRPYMSGVTAVEAHWLSAGGSPLRQLSDALSDPPPFYKKEDDVVLTWHNVAYGPKLWPLPKCTHATEDEASRCAVFACALLRGEVLPAFTQLGSWLAAQPQMLCRPELRGVARIGELVGALARGHVDSRASLLRQWRRRPEFLLQEVTMWVAKERGAQLLRLWPQLVAEGLAGAASAGAVAHHKGGKAKKRKQKGRKIENNE